MQGEIYSDIYPTRCNQDATLHSLFISGTCSTCFGWYLHPSSGAHTTVSTASGTGHIVTATCRYRRGVGTAEQSTIQEEIYSDIYPIRCNVTQFIYLWKLIYMFRVVPPPIIRSTYNCIYSICRYSCMCS